MKNRTDWSYESYKKIPRTGYASPGYFVALDSDYFTRVIFLVAVKPLAVTR